MTTVHYVATLASGPVSGPVVGYRLNVKTGGSSAYTSPIQAAPDFTFDVADGQYIFETEAMGANGQPVAPAFSEIVNVAAPVGQVPVGGSVSFS